MKYKFVYDPNILESLNNSLSEEETKIVLATVVGKHNAIFYGYRPERLVNAIKRLTSTEAFVEQKTFSDIDDGLNNSRGGIMYLKDFDVWKISEQQFLYGYTVNDTNRTTQFIATASISPVAGVIRDVLNNFDIVYRCKESEKIPKDKENLIHKNYDNILRFRTKLRSAHFITSTELTLSDYWMGDGVFSKVRKVQEDDPVYARKIALVARSLSDVEYSCYTEMEHLHEAVTFYKE